MVSFSVRAGAESGPSVSVRLWVGPELGLRLGLVLVLRLGLRLRLVLVLGFG